MRRPILGPPRFDAMLVKWRKTTFGNSAEL